MIYSKNNLPGSAIRAGLLLALLAPMLRTRATELYFAQGVLAGEVTATSAILQTRITAADGLVGSDVPGLPAVGRFEIATDARFSAAQRTSWLEATADHDFILKAAVNGLKPQTLYYFRAIAGSDRLTTKIGPIGTFRTLPAAEVGAPVRFILTSCLNYAFFRQGTRGRPAYDGADRLLGYPALEPLLARQPDFCVFAGDCVYYDHPVATKARTREELRRKWHEQYVQARFVRLFASVPTYWLKDDHDYRKDDSDPTGDYEPSHALGIATFREQIPVVNPDDAGAVTYRTHRMGRDLQVWMLEGRDYRSPNTMPDGPEKSVWGSAQTEWLHRTLKASDATFKVLISPTPMVGPDDATKKDNHVNEAGFRQEADRFFSWLKQSGIQPSRFFIICGDRHWKYHSVHPTGYQEFCSGALNRENARGGRAPGDAQSTDPKGLVRQLYKDKAPSGGFIEVQVLPASNGSRPTIEFTQYDDGGAALYRSRQVAP